MDGHAIERIAQAFVTARTEGKGLMGKAARARAARAAELRGLSATPAVKVLAFTTRTSSVMFSCWCDAQCGRVQ